MKTASLSLTAFAALAFSHAARADDTLLAPHAVIGSHGADFKMDSGFYYDVHAGPTSVQTAAVGSLVGYDFTYVGVNLNCDQTVVGKYDATGTGGQIYAQYPLGEVVPFVSLGSQIQTDPVTMHHLTTLGSGLSIAKTSMTSFTANVAMEEHDGDNLPRHVLREKLGFKIKF